MAKWRKCENLFSNNGFWVRSLACWFVGLLGCWLVSLFLAICFSACFAFWHSHSRTAAVLLVAVTGQVFFPVAKVWVQTKNRPLITRRAQTLLNAKLNTSKPQTHMYTDIYKHTISRYMYICI